jgi:formylglycine-generating enzyme
LRDYAWYTSNSGNTTQPVGEKKPNPYGLYDIVGNVWEWCSDWFDEEYYATSPAKNPKGPDSGEERVLRGGSYSVYPNYLLSTSQYANSPNTRHSDIGFRCARTP